MPSEVTRCVNCDRPMSAEFHYPIGLFWCEQCRTIWHVVRGDGKQALRDVLSRLNHPRNDTWWRAIPAPLRKLLSRLFDHLTIALGMRQAGSPSSERRVETCWRAIVAPPGRIATCSIYEDRHSPLQVRVSYSPFETMWTAGVRNVEVARSVAEALLEAFRKDPRFLQNTQSRERDAAALEMARTDATCFQRRFELLREFGRWPRIQPNPPRSRPKGSYTRRERYPQTSSGGGRERPSGR